jgi:hypothetical protein
MVLAAGLLGLASGCKKGSSSSNYTAAGTVTYTRLPITLNADGSPSGLGAAGVVTPARGVLVRAFQLYNEVNYSGQTVGTWRLVGSAVTDTNGAYSISGVIAAGYSTFVEVDSIFQQGAGHQGTVKLVADPDGIGSSATEARRPIYALRKDAAGTAFTDPTPATTSVAVAGGDVSANFNVGASDTWAVTDYDWYLPGHTTQANYMVPEATQAIGSRVLAILDSVYYFCYYYGDPTPSATAGGFLDLHYYPTAPATVSPLRDYVVYDPTAISATLTTDGNGKFHYFGSLSGSTGLDDAYDPGAIYPLLARNNLYGQGKTSLYPTGLSSLPSLSPDLAVVDGLADAMAATLLQRPFVTDLTSSTPLVSRDIRSNLPILANRGVASPATLAALAWELTLKAQALSDTPAQWTTINPNALQRFFTLVYPKITSGTATVQNDISSAWVQLGRLYEAKSGGEPIDLASIFYDLTLIPLTSNYGIPWTNVAYANSDIFSVYWGENPNSLTTPLPAITLSMANATEIDRAFPVGALTPYYPNCSQGEVAYAKLALQHDASYALSFTPPPPVGASIEVVVDGLATGAYTFSHSAAASTAAQDITLLGNASDSSTPAWHFLRFRLISPTVPQADYTFTVNLNLN